MRNEANDKRELKGWQMEPVTQKTVPLPDLSEEMEQTQLMSRVVPGKDLAAESNVRELEPAAPSKKTITGKTRRWKILAGGFAIALLAGFMIASYLGEQQQLAENDRIHQQQEIRQHQQQLTDLEQKKIELERKKEQLLRESAVLSQQQQQTKAEADTLLDKSDKIFKEVQQSSGVKKIWNDITGKTQEQKAAAADKSAAAQQTQVKAQSIKDSLDQAESMLGNVNEQLDRIDGMRQQAQQVKAATEAAVDGNVSVIDQATHYWRQGKALLSSMLN